VEKVDRSRSPHEALKATGRVIYADDDVVKTMPRGEGEGAETVFFKVGRGIIDDYQEIALKLADWSSLLTAEIEVFPDAIKEPVGDGVAGGVPEDQHCALLAVAPHRVGSLEVGQADHLRAVQRAIEYDPAPPYQD
jgi:hypothetical protein